eukprot:COSAG03_NODE_7302_length_937_cov_1.556086_1_plen_126_part_10
MSSTRARAVVQRELEAARQRAAEAELLLSAARRDIRMLERELQAGADIVCEEGVPDRQERQSARDTEAARQRETDRGTEGDTEGDTETATPRDLAVANPRRLVAARPLLAPGEISRREWEAPHPGW